MFALLSRMFASSSPSTLLPFIHLRRVSSTRQEATSCLSFQIFGASEHRELSDKRASSVRSSLRGAGGLSQIGLRNVQDRRTTYPQYGVYDPRHYPCVPSCRCQCSDGSPKPEHEDTAWMIARLARVGAYNDITCATGAVSSRRAAKR